MPHHKIPYEEKYPVPRRDKESVLLFLGVTAFFWRPRQWVLKSDAEFVALGYFYHQSNYLNRSRPSTKGVGWRVVDSLEKQGLIKVADSYKRFVTLTTAGHRMYEIEYWARKSPKVSVDEVKLEAIERERQAVDTYAQDFVRNPTQVIKLSKEDQLKLAEAAAKAKAERID